MGAVCRYSRPRDSQSGLAKRGASAKRGDGMEAVLTSQNPKRLPRFVTVKRARRDRLVTYLGQLAGHQHGGS